MKCPTCFAHLPPRPSRLECVGSCPTTHDANASKTRGYAVSTRRIFDVQPLSGITDGGRCPACHTPSDREVCPFCLGGIPRNWRSATVTCVAMAGSRETGKTIMLAVAAGQLSLWTNTFFGSPFRGVGGTDQLLKTHYTRPLFEQRSLVAPTATSRQTSVARDPLIFSYVEPSPSGPRTRILVLRDVAGEDLEALGGSDEVLTFFSRADAVIALIDPLSVSQVRALLADLINVSAPVGLDGVLVLQHVLRLMTAHTPGAKTSIPLAVVLSKVDALQQLKDVTGTTWARIMNRPGSPLQRDPSLRSPTFDKDDGDLLHEEVRGLLGELQAGTLDGSLREVADRYRFFAASALGASPRDTMIAAGGIAPFRVLDPFKWILSETA